MVTLEKFGNSAVKFEFENNSLYLNNGEITVPLNSLMLVIDDSELATFKKLNGDPFISVSYADLGMDKDELEQWYKDNMVGGTSGSSSGITPSEVQDMIDASISGYDEDIQDEIGEKEQVIAIALTELKNDKLDASAYTPTDLSEYWTSGETQSAIDAAVSDKADTSAVTEAIEAAVSGKADTTAVTADIAAAVSGKQDTLIAGTNITITNNVISASGGGGSVTIDPTLDSGSTNAVANSAITTALSGKADTTAVTADIAAAVSGKQDTLIAGENITISGNVISASGGGASYVAGDGITIDSANTISTTYRGFQKIENVESEFGNRTTDFYMIGGYDCEGEDVGYLQLFLTEEDYNNGYNYIITLDMTAHTYSVTTESEELDPNAWQDYLSISWDDNVNLFKATVLQELYYICDNYCGRVIEPQDIVIEHSGTTTNALDGAFSEMRTLSGNDVNYSYININDNYFSFSIGFKNDNGVTSNPMYFNGGLKEVNSSISTQMEYGEYGWHDAAINDGCCSDEFPSSSAVTFDISRNPAECMDDGDGYNIMDSNGDAAEPTYYNVVNDNGHVTVTCVGDRLLTRICDNYCELDQYVSNLKYYGAAHIGTIPQAVNALEASLSGKQDTLIAGSGITISGNVISAEGGGSITIDPTLDSGSTNAVANSAITTALSGKADTTAVTADIAAAVSGKIETSAITTSLTSGSTDSQVSSAKAVFDAMGGLRIVKLTQQEYDAMEQGGTLDNSTLYVVI